jgi:hypothetical protein
LQPAGWLDEYWAKGTDTLTLGDQAQWIYAKGVLASLRELTLRWSDDPAAQVLARSSGLNMALDLLPVQLSPYLQSIIAEVPGAGNLTNKQLRALRAFIAEPSTEYQYNVDDLYKHDFEAS